MRRYEIETVLVGGLSAGLLAGCPGEGGRASDSQSSGIVTAGSASATGTDSASATDGTSAGSATSTSAGTSAATSADGSGDDDTPVFDLGAMPDIGMPEEEGCQKVDFLFVVDNSGSMGDDQVNLANNFPNFINGIQATLMDVQSYQVGVITSDAYPYNAPGCQVLGALVTQTGGPDSSNMNCAPYASGARYMTEADDLAAKFACAAKVGSGGSGFEQMMNAMEVAVVHSPTVAACNDGYIRDDALLVIVLITDEWDGPNDPDNLFGMGCGPNCCSCGDENSWFNTVVNAKGGIESNIVVVSLIHPDSQMATCPTTDGYFSGHIEAFTNQFTNGFVGCITDDYGQIFMEATTIIESACANFEPPA